MIRTILRPAGFIKYNLLLINYRAKNTNARRYLKIAPVVAVCGLMAIFSCGCDKPSYPKERLISDVKDMVRKDYGYEIKAAITGKTLGLFLPVPQIFNYDLTVNDSFSQKTQDVFLCAARVALSTDADLEFFSTVYTDQVKGIDISMIRSVLDTKKLLLGAISRNDYYERTVFQYKYNLDILAEKTIRKLIQDIPQKRSAVTTYFMPDSSFNESFFFGHLMESELKDQIYYSVLSLKTKRIGHDEVLVYLKTRENYKPKHGYEFYKFAFPSGAVHEFMFELKIIKGILPIIVKNYAYNESVDGQIIQKPMPYPFSEHADISAWDSYFYLEEIKLQDFLIQQLATKINRKINEADNPKAEKREDDMEHFSEPPPVAMAEGQYLLENEGASTTSFQLIFRFKDNIAVRELSKDFTNNVLKFFKRIMEKYNYSSYNKLIFLSVEGEVINSFDKNTIDRLQLEDKSWKSIIKPSQY